jgi:hypothetical protein
VQHSISRSFYASTKKTSRDFNRIITKSKKTENFEATGALNELFSCLKVIIQQKNIIQQ